MKRFLLSCLLIACMSIANYANAQVYFEDFSNIPINGTPQDWITASNTSVAENNRPGTCTVINKGLQTPGVGQSAPTAFVLPSYTINPANNSLVVKFKIFVYASGGQGNPCTSILQDFPCPVAVNAYLVPTNLPNNYNPTTIPPTTSYASLPEYKILDANAENTVIFNNVNLPAGVTSFRVQLVFKSVSSTNCANSGIKYVFDDFNLIGAKCDNGICKPIANTDYFNSDVQNLFSKGSTSFSGNVYGGYALWSSQAPSGYDNHSLTFSPAENGGLDYDLNNTSLANVTFAKTGNLTFEAGSACVGTPSNIGTLVFNSNGTFTYSRGATCVTRVSFTYSITTAIGTSNAKVIIDLPGNNAALPVTYTSFNAVRKNNTVALTWETASEENNRGFYIQRNTGGDWKDVAFVFSAAVNGNSNANLSYAYNDANASKGASQYRILQVDIDGKGRYSEIRSVRGLEQAAKIVVFPNPSTDKINVMFEDAQSVREVTVTDIAGRVVKQYRNVTSNSLSIDNLKDGFYNIQVTDRHTGATVVEKAVMKKR